MIPRPENLVRVKVKVQFNLRVFESLEIDLSHINKNKRSSYSVSLVTDIVVSVISNLLLEPVDSKFFDDESCTYYLRTGVHENKRYKIVFCICSDMPNVIGVITLHRV